MSKKNYLNRKVKQNNNPKSYDAEKISNSVIDEIIPLQYELDFINLEISKLRRASFSDLSELKLQQILEQMRKNQK